MKVSFDFDDTLKDSYTGEPCKPAIKRLIHHLNEGDEVYIVTSRVESDKSFKEIRDFLFDHAEPVDGIYFTRLQPKVYTLEKLGVELHYDDDKYELSLLKAKGIKGEFSVFPEDGQNEKKE